MAKNQKSSNFSLMFTNKDEGEWIEEHIGDLQQYVSGQRLLYQSLLLALVFGLAAHIGGYVLLSSQPNGLMGLLADLLHALSWSLWTGVVVAVFVEVIPEVKRRQIKQSLDAYEEFRKANGERRQKSRKPARRKNANK